MPDGVHPPDRGSAASRQPLDRLIGDSPGMEQVRDQIRRFARSPVPVLIVGETGTGKELCAEAIAHLSGRKPFIPVNCAALPEGLVESELFGHERGAFTGAVRSQAGVIALVNGGTLFLDELTEVPTTVQAKLLRTLESGEYWPLGSSQALRSQFRILAAISGEPERSVSAGHLRADLFHRLGAVRVRLPPLRERIEDIPLLVEDFLHRYSERADTVVRGMRPDVCAPLMRQLWPGNVRQLRNVVEAAAALAGVEPLVSAQHVREVLSSLADGQAESHEQLSLGEVRRRAERLAIADALRTTSGNRERAAKLLRISEATLYRKLGDSPPAKGSSRTGVTRKSEGHD